MKYEGAWHIVDMELWDEDYFNMQVQAYIHIGSNGIGDFQFCLVSDELDGEIVKSGNPERFEFTWEGQDENDPVFGTGRLAEAFWKIQGQGEN